MVIVVDVIMNRFLWYTKYISYIEAYSLAFGNILTLRLLEFGSKISSLAH